MFMEQEMGVVKMGHEFFIEGLLAMTIAICDVAPTKSPQSLGQAHQTVDVSQQFDSCKSDRDLLNKIVSSIGGAGFAQHLYALDPQAFGHAVLKAKKAITEAALISYEAEKGY
jgi:hypothetical protein